MKLTALPRPNRAAAAVGGVVALGAAALMAVLGGPASAATAGTCTDNVNVREAPQANAKIIAVCDRGTAVQIGATRNGFVELENFKGWSVAQYVKANDAAAPAAAPANRQAPANPQAPATTPAPAAAAPALKPGSPAAEPAETTTVKAPTEKAKPLGGLLGG